MEEDKTWKTWRRTRHGGGRCKESYIPALGWWRPGTRGRGRWPATYERRRDYSIQATAARLMGIAFRERRERPVIVICFPWL
jgi:hypothetical protein